MTPHVFCTSLSVCTVGKLLAPFTVGVTVSGLSVEVGLALLGLYLRWGKPRLATSRSCLGTVVVPKALAMTCLSVVASPFAILPSPSSRFCPLAPLLLQQLVPYCLIVLPDCPAPPRLRPVVI